MENVTGFRVERDEDSLSLTFCDDSGLGERYTFMLKDAENIAAALFSALLE